MPLKDVLQQFLNEEEWKDEINHDADDDTDYINTGYQIDGQNYRLILITDEESQLLKVTLVSPIKIPKLRMKEATFVLNFLNLRSPVGNLAMSFEDGTLFYRWEISVGGATAATQQFRTLIGAASGAFDEIRSAAIGAAAVSKVSVEDIYKDYDEAVKKAAEEPPSTH